jgi:death-on-curing protein
MRSCLYLSVREVIQLHTDGIAEHGGSPVLRDGARLESAVMQPRASFGGVSLHPTLADKAAAYLFHIAKAHTFIDGNKRVATRAALVFLDLNGFDVEADTDKFYDIIMAVIAG